MVEDMLENAERVRSVTEDGFEVMFCMLCQRAYLDLGLIRVGGAD